MHPKYPVLKMLNEHLCALCQALRHCTPDAREGRRCSPSKECPRHSPETGAMLPDPGTQGCSLCTHWSSRVPEGKDSTHRHH